MRLDCDVLVVGLGPVGDVIAGLCATEGLKVVAIDREAIAYPLPRAAVFDDEIMRIFQQVGVAERLEPLCRTPDRYEFISAAGEILLDFPVKGVPTISGWEGSYVLHQPAVEGVLRERIAELGVDVRLGHRFVDLTQDDAGVTATIAEGERTYRLRARYIVGADGAWSPVRTAIGGTLFDYEFDEPWLVIDAIAPDGMGLPDRLLQICDPRRPMTYLKMTGDRYRWECMMHPGETVEQVTDDDFIRNLLAPWGVGDDLVIERKAVYRFHGLVANRWRDNRVLLAGDAAHQMPPFAGQGMCSGVRDAVNLCWKLGSVIRGEADAGLLDSYQAEREPHARAVIETAVAMGRIVCLRDPDAAAGRDMEMLARRASGAQDLSMRYPDLVGGCLDVSEGSGSLFVQPIAAGRRMDDALGRGYWLITRSPTTLGTLPPSVTAYDLSSPEVQPYSSAISNWLDAHGAEAVLVRPDHHVFGTGSADRLLTQLAHATDGRVVQTA